MPEEWDLFSRPWYEAAIENPGQTVVRNPFWSVVEQTWATSISRTTPFDDGAEDVVSFTIRLDAVFDMMDDFEVYGGGYVFLVGSDSVIVTHPSFVYTSDDALVPLETLEAYNSVLSNIFRHENSIPFVTEDGVPAYIFTRALDSSDWLMVSVVYADNINEVVNNLTTIVLATVSVILIVMSVLVLAQLSRLIRKAIAHSVTEFRESSASLAKGDGLKISSNRDTSFGLNEISEEFDNNLTIMADLIDDLSNFSHEVGNNANIAHRIDAQKYSGSFKEVIQSINNFADRFVEALKHVMEQKEQVQISEANNQAKSRFLANMSHEIRTPMNAILGITEIQLQKNIADKDIREAFEKVYASSDMLLGIVNDILDLSKIEDGKMELIIEKYEVASTINDTATLNMMRIEDKDIKFEVSVEETMPACLSGDELRIKQILNNILSNAFKYTEKGLVKMAVSAQPGESPDAVVLAIAVSDTGQGMSQEQIDMLFDAYSRFNAEANRFTEGTGLGMSITSNLINMMGGKISVESEVGKGSTFTVYLPQAKADGRQIGKETAANLSAFRSSSQAKRVQVSTEAMPYGKVLIVDDVPINIFVAKGLMAPYELQMDSADSGFAAVERIEAGNEYDVVFMDHMMPKMDGIEAAKRLREIGYTRPIVALTANAIAGQAAKFLENGFDDFISKPINIRQLDRILNKFVRDATETKDLS